jgi:hypothetical protein
VELVDKERTQKKGSPETVKEAYITPKITVHGDVDESTERLGGQKSQVGSGGGHSSVRG